MLYFSIIKASNYHYIENEIKFKKIIDAPNQNLYVATDNNNIIAYIEF